ncbi:MAG: dephospho-CoA kinase [Amaricoccus sp.]|uniref:dephospho-CoA kinase n=1 Tax=Amaricoccus sp. TaxID=1872485 RepID=UPI0039E24A75
MTRPWRLGLTGSIGMGKSTTAGLFREQGVPVWDADASVHALYARGGAAVPAIAALVPAAIEDGAVRRDRLRAAIVADPGLLGRIEAVVHPLVAADRAAFLAAHRDAALVLLDIPLLFETGGAGLVDEILVVSAPAEVQRARVLERPGMDAAALEHILARQLSDADKRARAHHVLDTSRGMAVARADVAALLARIRQERHDA